MMRTKSMPFSLPAANLAYARSSGESPYTTAPATIVGPSRVKAQQQISPYPVKAAISSPLSRPQSRGVPSVEPETARPLGVTHGVEVALMALEKQAFWVTKEFRTY